MTYRAPNPEVEARARAERKTATLLGILFAVFMVVSIGGMMIFDAYGEKLAGAVNAPKDAADH